MFPFLFCSVLKLVNMESTFELYITWKWKSPKKDLLSYRHQMSFIYFNHCICMETSLYPSENLMEFVGCIEWACSLKLGNNYRSYLKQTFYLTYNLHKTANKILFHDKSRNKSGKGIKFYSVINAVCIVSVIIFQVEL